MMISTKKIFIPIIMGIIFPTLVKSSSKRIENNHPHKVSCYYFPTSDDALTADFVTVEEERSAKDDKVAFLKFHLLNNKEMKISLKRSEGLLVGKDTRVWTVRRKNRNSTEPLYTLQENALQGVEMYTDEDSKASFSMMTDKEGFRHYSGIIDYTYGFKSEPKGPRQRRDNSRQKSTISTVDHIIYHMPDSKNSSYHFADFYSTDNIKEKHNYLDENQRKIPLPDTIYPEILVIMDYKLYRYYRGNMTEALSYILTFWNAVDLKYRDFTEPKVRLHIKGIILETEPGTILRETMARDKKGRFLGKINGNMVLNEIGEHLHLESNLTVGKDFDLALLMTGNDLTYDTTQPKERQHALYGLIGLAYLASACTVRQNRFLGVGIFEDTNGYIGVIHAAHELAHILGALHDGDKLLEIVKGANRCEPTPEDDYIMSTLRIDGKQFSVCSKELMRTFFQSTDSQCLRNSPSDSNTDFFFVNLPGKVISLDEQCQSAGFLKAYNTNEDVCHTLYCVGKNFDGDIKNATHIPAVEGSFCGEGRHCINGTCVSSVQERRSEKLPENYYVYNNIDRRIYIG